MIIETDDRTDLLKAFLELAGICEAQRELVGQAVTKLVTNFSTAKVRPKWRDRSQYEILQKLTAVGFMKLVYADMIRNGSIVKADIRTVDPELMGAVESYICRRLQRWGDYGEAADLKFISTCRPLNAQRRQSVVTYETPRP